MIRQRHARARAFTLIELLVVVAILALVLGLLLSAVQKVREAAARTACRNNLRQVGLALHAYEQQAGSLPPGYRNPGGSTSLPGWGWAVFLLPYLDQENLHEALDVAHSTFGGGANPVPATPLTQTPLKVLQCPADPGPPTNPYYDQHGRSSYRGVGGGGDLYLKPMDTDLGGLFFANSRVRFADVTDGLSNTLAVGETSLDEPRNRWGGIWAGCARVGSFGPYLGNLTWVSGVYWSVGPGDLRLNGPDPWAFGSTHPGGGTFLVADGAVRFVHDSVAPNLLERLAVRNDGAAIGLPD